MNLRPYPKVKPSGVEWLGNVPEHWQPISLKWVSHRYAGGTPDRSNDAYWDEGTIPWINSGAVNQELIKEPSSFITEEGYRNSSARFVPEGALVMALAGQGKTKGMVAQTAIRTTCNQSMAAIVPRESTNPRYLFWLLGSQYEQIRNMAGGEARDGLNLDILGSIPCFRVPEDEQRAIADFLDRETAKLDTLVEKKRALIEKLKEKRAALISRTVTRGLPPDVARAADLNPHPKLKPPGVEWLGDVPEHWEVMTIKRVARSMISGPFGSSLTKDKYSESGYRVYGQEQVIPGDFSVGDYYIPEDYFLEMKRYAVSVGDVLVSCVGTFGKVAVVPEGIEPGIINPRLILIRPSVNRISPKYLGQFIRSYVAYEQLQSASRGGTMDIINMGLLGDLVLPLPPLAEQTAIADYLDRETTKIDRMVGKVEAAVDRLREYRSALITAAVTGKIDVRGAVAGRGETIPNTV